MGNRIWFSEEDPVSIKAGIDTLSEVLSDKVLSLIDEIKKLDTKLGEMESENARLREELAELHERQTQP